jgi:Pyruvate/2-oxoacid:ferredoxin oxidoreductase delta subunit
MADNVLKKSFKPSDVKRLRNLIQGKVEEKITFGVGYDKKQEFYKEGDVWEENGRQWTIKDGIKQNITRLDKAKNLIVMPLFCPSCSSLMKNKNDKLFYIQYNRCFNCQIDFETELHRLGLWETYEKNIINTDIDNVIKDYSVWVDEMINSSNENFITEAGDIEHWVGNTNKKLLENKEETIKYLQSLKK